MRSRTVRRWLIVLVGMAALGAHVAPAGASEITARPEASATFNGNVYSVGVGDDVVYVGGHFTRAYDEGATASRYRLAAVSADSGRLLDWAPSVDGAVRAITEYQGSVYIAGDFAQVNGEERAGVAKLDAVTGELDPTFAPAVEGRALALAVGHGRLYVGGSFTEVNGQPRSNLAAVSPATGAVDTYWAPKTDNNVYTVEVDDTHVYLGGNYTQLNGDSAYQRLAAVDPATGAADPEFRPGLSAMVRDLALGSEGLYAATGGAGGRLVGVSYEGSIDWVVAANGDFQAVTVLDDVVYAGGHYNQVCTASTRTDPDGTCLDGSVTRRKFAAFDLDGTLLGWAPQANSAVGVHALAADPERSAVASGGEFTSLGDGTISQPYFALFG